MAESVAGRGPWRRPPRLTTGRLVGGSDCGWGVAGEPGWEVVEKANARALERRVVAVGVEGVAVHIARRGQTYESRERAERHPSGTTL